jgi:HK97 family phage major capsid protein
MEEITMAGIEQKLQELMNKVQDLATPNHDAIKKAFEELKEEAKKVEVEPAFNNNESDDILRVKAHKGSDEKHYQESNDKVLFQAKLIKSFNPELNWDVACKNAPAYKEYADMVKSVDKTSVSSFVPTRVSANYIASLRNETPVANALTNINFRGMASPQQWHVSTGMGGDAYLIGENTNDTGAKVKARDAGGSTVTFTRKMIGFRTVVSKEFALDSIVPYAEFLQEEMRARLADNLESAIINGQASGSFDDETEGSLDDSDDPRYAWDGLRYNSVAVGQNIVSGATFTSLAPVYSAIAKLDGAYKKNNQLMIIGDSNVVLKLTGLVGVIPYNDQIQLNNGIAARVAGIPVYESVQIPLTHTDGKISGTGGNNVKSSALVVAKDAVALGVFNDVDIETAYDIESRQHKIVASMGYGLSFYRTATTTANRGVSLIHSIA